MKNMNLNDAVANILLAGAFVVFGLSQSWQSVCVILIASSLKALCVYCGRKETSSDVKILEEKIAKAVQDIKAVNFRLGFAK